MIAPRPEVAATSFAEHGGRLALVNETAGVLRDFSVCLNAYGPADVVARAIAEARVDEYPDPRSHGARNAAAARWDRPASEIVFGAGAAELIHAVCFAYLRPGDRVLVATPAFGEYARAASLCGAGVITSNLLAVPDAADHFSAEIERVRPRLAFVASPASPTGETLGHDVLRRIADAARANDCLLVLDQAYDAFVAAPLGTPALPGHDAVMHLRSMTKEHALAGIRVAFAVASPTVAEALERTRVPWAASSVAQAAGVATMTDGAMAHVDRTTALLRGEAFRISGALRNSGIQVRSPTTHFFLVRCPSGRETRARLLAEHRFLVRDCDSFGLRDWIRVAARTPGENDLLISALTTVLT